MNEILTKERLIEARERISNQVKRTPILTSSSINKILNANIFFKCENFQKVGAFKFRGASNAVLSLNEKEMINGVATHSSGNHAAALALAAKMKNIPAYIVMPKTAPEIKKKAVAGYGAKIIFCEPTLKAREETLNNVIQETNAIFIHPYDNYDVIAGQSTAAQEIFAELNDLDFIIAPVGGGGLLSGTALSTKYFSPKTKIIGAEPKEADDAFKSFNDKKIYPSINPKTICDGLLTQLSEKTFKIITNTVDEILTAKEETIIEAMKLIWERMKIIIEPSSAVTLAIMIENQEKFLNKKIAIILSGGNVDLKNLPFK
ncbi:pyridoxal-phosphate dependent enzyme [Stygiobacter electus]|jgi:threonine dehydratase|uniref:Pyridoxal-phosphate dependent enzyme n=1 Tax=Stygiobacter electus TaxID=3032292 RepID=A0AAE3P1M5_9BACT|nr:pyridoxal-phosphate dependent enzyme [Stygiobacter electus]MDF1612590.1 pyridoxal-phosphate dependent enzyme [Stygiobacter electus]